MGFISEKFDQELGNRTKCRTWNDVYESHMEKENNVVLKFDDIKGILIILAIGFAAATLIFTLENFNHRVINKKVK